MGRPMKPDHLRQRRNKVTTAAQLGTPEAASENEVPPLPDREKGWHPNTVGWWESVWKSPMASEYLGADMKGGLYLLAELHQARWETTDRNELLKIAAEIRQQSAPFGLSPIDRQRLRWTIEQGETAAARTEQRRQGQIPEPGKKAKDPRSILQIA